MAVETHEGVGPMALPDFKVRVVWFEPSRRGSPFMPVRTVAALRQLLAPYDAHERLVISLERDGGESIWLHLSGDRAWVSHFTEPGGVDSCCRDAEYDGPDRSIEFRLSNGQADEVHRYWTIARAEAMEALGYFLLHAERDPSLDWVSEPGSLRDRP